MSFNWKEVLFWIALIASIILLAWYLFGSGPTELIAIIAIIFSVIVKVWIISDRQIRLENELKIRDIKIKDGFINVRGELSLIKKDLNLIKKKLKV